MFGLRKKATNGKVPISSSHNNFKRLIVYSFPLKSYDTKTSHEFEVPG